MWEKQAEPKTAEETKQAETAQSRQAVGNKAQAKNLVLPVQLLICGGIVLTVLALRFFAPSIYHVLQKEYPRLLETGMSLSDEVRIARFAYAAVENVRTAVQQAAGFLGSL